MTYYTCDECEWAGPFENTRSHYEESGHDAYSRRDDKTTEAIGQPVQHHHYHVSYPQPWCNHTFTWMSTLPATHCPKCGVQLRAYPYSQPTYTITSPNVGSVKPTLYNGAVTAAGSSGANYTVTWDASGPDGTAGSTAKL